MMDLLPTISFTILAMLITKMYFSSEDRERCRILKQVAILDFVLAISALVLYFLK